ncbi:unnamed protein product, partial [Sphacelaria rigidula]
VLLISALRLLHAEILEVMQNLAFSPKHQISMALTTSFSRVWAVLGPICPLCSWRASPTKLRNSSHVARGIDLSKPRYYFGNKTRARPTKSFLATPNTLLSQ